MENSVDIRRVGETLDQKETRRQSKDERIKNIRRDLTRWAHSLEQPLKYVQQTHLESLNLRIKRLAEMYGLDS